MFSAVLIYAKIFSEVPHAKSVMCTTVYTGEGIGDANVPVEMTHRSGSFSMIDFSFWKKKIQPCLTAVTSVRDGLKGLYNEKLKPLERTYRFNDFASLKESDFDAKTMVMLLGQYSTGKINFIKHLLKCNYPGSSFMHININDRPKIVSTLASFFWILLQGFLHIDEYPPVLTRVLTVRQLYSGFPISKQMKKALFNGTPEFSMPYNVITITCTVFSLYFGSLLNALHRRTEEEARLLKSKVNFTPESKMGKMLMAKCRTLQEENKEIGNQANEGKCTIRIITLHPNSNWLFLKCIDKPAGAGHKNGKWHVLHALCADY
ncbi:EH domain-containing protein 2 [Capsicum baccatum]|uniref:EH domain-containing protein 2 n=1 Tax=Capsicum baccatum TaxID=33114 RepID=A0A2G2XIU4_CAPBA|nr:EH domain-containing protein 2 [Capsicum baccatum]